MATLLHQCLVPTSTLGVKVPNLSSRRKSPVKVFAADQHDSSVAVQTKQQESSALSSIRRNAMTPSILDYWDPFNFTSRSLRQMMETMDRIFGDTSSLGMIDTSAYMRTPWDIMEDDESYHMRIDLPGFGKDEVKIQVEDRVLIVNAEHCEEDPKQDKWKKRSRGKYSTRIALPDTIDVSKVSAKMINGVLEVCIPKVKKEKQIVDVKLE